MKSTLPKVASTQESAFLPKKFLRRRFFQDIYQHIITKSYFSPFARGRDPSVNKIEFYPPKVVLCEVWLKLWSETLTWALGSGELKSGKTMPFKHFFVCGPNPFQNSIVLLTNSQPLCVLNFNKSGKIPTRFNRSFQSQEN